MGFAFGRGCPQNSSFPHLKDLPTMNMPSQEATPVQEDPLASRVDRHTQREGAELAQDAFTRVFRWSFDPDEQGVKGDLAALKGGIESWIGQGRDEEEALVRRALVLAGLDQWGLAYTQAFELTGLPQLSALLGQLRNELDPRQEARLLQHYALLGERETAAIDFKVTLRRAIHLALWHGAIAAEGEEEALHLIERLAEMMRSLVALMPQLGWRLGADALAHVQIRCLTQQVASSGIAQQATQALFAELEKTLPAACYQAMMRLATESVQNWQAAQRGH